jgi:two-component system LytT family response regulator
MSSGEEKIRAIIADDEQLARQLLVTLADEQPDLSIVGLAENGDAAIRMIDAIKPDLVFLDVMMPKIDGIELMQSFSQKPDRPYVVFVTAFDEYAVRAFDLDALDYLVKPIERDRFAQTVARARAAIHAKRAQRLGEKVAAVSARADSSRQARNKESCVIVKRRDELIQIPENDIYWLEAASQYVHIHTQSNHYVVSESLNRYHARLSPDLFVRVHRSAVVNISKVKRVLRKQNGVHELKLENGAGVPLSRSRRTMVNEFLGICTALSETGQML